MEFAYNFGALGIPVFLVLMLFEYLALKKRNLHVYSDSVTSGSMGAGLLVSEALFKVYTLGVYIWLWDSFRIFDFETTSVVTWIVFFFGVDFCYYWFHRIAHERNILWGAHEGHHQGEEFNYTTAIRQSAFQYGFSWIFYLPLAILGCPPEVFLGQFVILKGYQYWIHTQGIDRVPFIEGIFSTPSSHRVHHAKNPTYIDRNYGGTMVIWDRMFGTWQPELRTEACHYGTTNAPETLSPLKLNLRHWRNLFSDTIRTKKFSDKIGLWFKPTGWRPADCVEPNHHLQKEGTIDRPKYDPETTTARKVYAGFASLLTFVSGTMFIFLSPQLDFQMKAIGATLIILGLVSIGSILENKSKMIAVELVRVPAMLGFIYTLWNLPITTTVVDTVAINKPTDDSLSYAANISKWPEWHPQSTTVEINKAGPLLAGEKFQEEISTPIGPNQLEWTGVEYIPNTIWAAKAENLTNGSTIQLTYRVFPTADGQTEFERRLDYTMPNFALVAANALYFKNKVEEKSEQGLVRLKTAIEAI